MFLSRILKFYFECGYVRRVIRKLVKGKKKLKKKKKKSYIETKQ